MAEGQDRAGVTGAVAVVTGAAGGLGAAIAAAVAEVGGTPVLVDRAPLDGTIELIESRHGIRAPAFSIDVGDAEQVEAVAAEVEATLGGCTILVNNAAIYRRAPLEDHDLDLWDETMRINLRGYFVCTVRFGRSMLAAGRGSIVNVSSIAAHGPTPKAGAYGVAKAGVLALTRQTALEWGPRGVRANSVSPGFLNTSMASVAYDEDPELTARRRERVPVGRIGETVDVARTVLFLAGDESSYVNGIDIVVDGGLRQTLAQSFPRPAET